MKSTLSEKGQVTIPKAVRDRLGLSAGMEIEFTAEAGRIIGIKKSSEDPFRAWLGKGLRPPGFRSVDAHLQALRDR